MFKHLAKNKHGDTLVEVTLAIGIFSMVAVAAVSVLSASTSSAEDTLEASITREQIDAQADALRFIQNAALVDHDTATPKFSNLWDEIKKNAIVIDNTMTDSRAEELLQYVPDSCSENYSSTVEHNGVTITNDAYNKAFIINLNQLSNYANASMNEANAMLGSVYINKDAKNNAASPILAPTSTYPRLVYGNNNAPEALFSSDTSGDLLLAEGIYVVAVKDSRNRSVGETPDYYDFYIRTCWYGTDDSERPSTISTVIRLNDLDATKYEIVEQRLKFKSNDNTIGTVKSNYPTDAPLLQGKEIRLTAEIKQPGFKFLGWYDNNGVRISENSVYSCVIGAADCITSVVAKFGIEINVLNIYPDEPRSNVFHDWMARWGLNEKDPDGEAKKIVVDSVPISEFNANPNRYLKNGNNWKYDILVFGFWDCNYHRDLSQASRDATEAYLRANKAVVFGHDTITDYCSNHPQFNSLASYAGLTHLPNNPNNGSSSYHYPWAAGDKLRIVEDSRMTSYPHQIYGRILDVPYSHEIQFTYRDAVGGKPTGKVLIRYNNNLSSDTQSNFYLGTYKKTATIMTGHSSGAASQDEQKIFANLIFYLYGLD